MSGKPNNAQHYGNGYGNEDCSLVHGFSLSTALCAAEMLRRLQSPEDIQTTEECPCRSVLLRQKAVNVYFLNIVIGGHGTLRFPWS